MVTPELVALLKQVNVSRDKEKTAERVKNAFSAASRKDKHTIEELSGQKRTSIYRVFKTGSVSAKVILPLSEVLNISPYWFIGETDEQESCSDALVLRFLEERGYKIAQLPKAKRARKVKAAAAEAAPAESAAAEEDLISVTVTLSNTEKMRQAVDNLDAEGAAQLLQGLFLRARAGGNAEQLWDVVKLCLLS